MNYLQVLEQAAKVLSTFSLSEEDKVKLFVSMLRKQDLLTASEEWAKKKSLEESAKNFLNHFNLVKE